MRHAIVVSVAAWALAGCARRARVELTVVPGVKPPRAIARCRTTGPAPVKVTWKLGPAVRQIGYNVPKDEAAVLVQWTEGAQPAQLGIACTAEDAVGGKLTAGTSLAAPTIAHATVAGGSVTVDGSGFGAPLGDEDGVWLLGRGRVLRANGDPRTCKGASWDDRKIVLCAPVGAAGPMELRIATGGRLALAPVDVKP